MNAQVHDFPTQPAPAKKRTITITGRAPITIIEAEWPIVAEGGRAYEPDGAPFGWNISMKVRRHIDAGKRHRWQVNDIIHAVYSFSDDDEGYVNQTVRVGRLLEGVSTADAYWKHIREVGEELRERMLREPLKKYVTLVVDDVLAKLPAHPV